MLTIYGDWGQLFLRLALGLIFLVHGWPKIKNLKTTAANFSAMGFRPGIFWGPLVALLEFFGGVSLILGACVLFSTAFLSAEFFVIIVWKLIKRQSFVGGIEFDLLILAALLALLFSGAGMFSLDQSFLFYRF